MPGSARRLGPADGELHELKGQNLKASTCSVGPLDNINVVQKHLHQERCSERAEKAVTEWHCLTRGY